MSLSPCIPLTIVIPTLNEADRLADCLESVNWAAEVIVADAGSSDATVAIATAHGARVIDASGLTIAGQRNAAIALASHPWVLALDADERATPELAESIRAALANPTADAYRIHFRNRYLGAPMERGGWGRDRHVRLARASIRWKVKRVHEHLDYTGPVGDLTGRIDHDSYRSLEHQLRKVTTYSQWGADDLQRRGARVGVSHLALRPIWRFIKCYLLQGAWREGQRGLILSVVHAWSAFAKYAILWDQQRLGAAATVKPESAAAYFTRLTSPSERAPDSVTNREPVTSIA